MRDGRIRIKNMAVVTEESYVSWNRRFTRFCHQEHGQSPQAAGPPAGWGGKGEIHHSPRNFLVSPGILIVGTTHFFCVAPDSNDAASPPIVSPTRFFDGPPTSM